jgi:hypothetical protein
MAADSSLIPGLRYTDGPAAIDFLCRAFGFVRQLVVMTPGGQVAHAQRQPTPSKRQSGAGRIAGLAWARGRSAEQETRKQEFLKQMKKNKKG